MSISEIQESIIQKVLNTEDEQLLKYLYSLLSSQEEREVYKLSDFEKSILNESQKDYVSGKFISDEEAFKSNKRWLEE